MVLHFCSAFPLCIPEQFCRLHVLCQFLCLQFGEALGTQESWVCSPCRTGWLLPSQGKPGNILTAITCVQKKDAKLRIFISKEAEDTEVRMCLSWGLRKKDFFSSRDMACSFVRFNQAFPAEVLMAEG